MGAMCKDCLFHMLFLALLLKKFQNTLRPFEGTDISKMSPVSCKISYLCAIVTTADRSNLKRTPSFALMVSVHHGGEGTVKVHDDVRL